MEVQGEMYVCESVHVCVHLCVCMCAQVNVSTFREGFICERGGVWGVCGPGIIHRGAHLPVFMCMLAGRVQVYVYLSPVSGAVKV